jgi:N-acetylmuramoyl-L-alanine amidase
MKSYTVQQGECGASIAFEHGFFAETLWGLPENEELRKLRKNLYVLNPGDVIVIPDPRPRIEKCATDKIHRFRRIGVPDKLNLRFLENGEPRAGIPWELKLDGTVFQGTTDSDGFVRQALLPNVQEALLVLRPGGGKPDENYKIQLRRVDPVSEIAGQQARLKNLGLFDREIDGETSPEFEEAVKSFQAANNIDPTGKVDDATQQALQKAYGC